MPQTPPPPDRIVILDPDDLHYARMTNPSAFSDPHTVITSPAEVGEVVPAPYQHKVLPLVEAGVILLRNPLASSVEFVREAQAHEELAVAKFLAFTVVCQALYAKKVTIDDERVTHQGGEWRFNGDTTAGPLANLNAEANYEKVRRILQKVHIMARFEPRSRLLSRPNVEKAREIARSLGIEHDATVARLLDMRANTDNPLREFESELDITAEASKAFKSALGLEMILRKIAPSLAAKLDRLKVGNDRMTLKVVVHF